MFSKFSVKKPFTVFVAIIIVIILGVVSWTKMTVDLIPSLNLPYAVIVTTLPGASPEEIESTISAPLESTLATISNIDEIQSVSTNSVSMVMLQFLGDTNMDSAMIEMREQIDMYTAMPTYPENAGSPMIIKVNMNLLPVEVITASMKGMNEIEANKYVEDKILPEIESVEGVASVTATGLLKNMVDVTISKSKLETLQKSIEEKLQAAVLEQITAQVEPVVEEQVRVAVEEQVKAGLAASGVTEITPGYENLLIQAVDEALPSAVEAAMPAAIEAALAEFENSDDAKAMSDITSNINTDMISGILTAENFSMPAGSVLDTAGFSYSVKVGDKYSSIDEFKQQTLFNVPNYGNIKLDDVANVTQYTNLDSIYSKVNGEAAVMFVIMKNPEFSTATVTNAVEDKMTELKDEHQGLEFTTLMNQGEYVNIMVDSIAKNLLIGALLAVVVIVLFLRRFRPTIIVSVSILISLVFALVLMYLGGISLNMISMGGLLLAVGMLVDNSIVVIENIFRRRSEGENATDSAIKGANQVAGAVTASTLTTIVVFVPIVFTKGITKQLFTDMALTIGFVLVASLLVSLTLVPSCMSFLKSSEKDTRKIRTHKMANVYGKMLANSLKHKWVSLALAVFLLAGSIGGVFLTGVELFPSMDSGQISVSPEIPENYSWNERVEALDKLNAILLETESAETVGIMDTSGDTSGSGSVMSMMGSSGTTIYLALSEERDKSTDEITADLQERIAAANLGFDVTISSSSMDLSSMTGAAVSIRLSGNDLDGLRKATADIANIVKGIEGTTDVVSDADAESLQKEIKISVDKEKAILNSLTVAQVFQSVYGDISAPASATTLSLSDGSALDVYVKDENTTYNSENIGNIEVTGTEKQKVSDIATITEEETFKQIARVDQLRVTFVSATLLDGYETLKVNKEIEKALEKYDLPNGVSYELAGENESINESFNDLFLMLILAVIFIYLVMVAQFQSLKSPFIVMFTLPLAATGGLLALFLTGNTISVISLVGFVLLAGVIVNNGIVFVDYANQMRAEGMSLTDALVKTGKDRLRPILMTALTTIIAMFATVFDTGQGSEMIKPMALVNVGGILYGTLLTLFVVPSLYATFNKDKGKKINKKTNKK